MQRVPANLIASCMLLASYGISAPAIKRHCSGGYQYGFNRNSRGRAGTQKDYSGDLTKAERQRMKKIRKKNKGAQFA